MESEKHEHVVKKGDESFTVKKVALWQGISGVLLVLLAVSVFTDVFDFGKEDDSDNVGVKVVPSAPSGAGDAVPAARVQVDVGGAPSKGGKDAPVTLIEFSDFQCPFCGRFFSDTAPQIEEQYVKAGKVWFVYKHFPLDSIHSQATPAALASECAKEQGKFWEYHDLIFKNQQSLGDESYKAWAKQLSLDVDKFNSCYSSQKYLSVIKGDVQQGSSAGIRGTPGFFLNGQLISGAQPFAVFQQAIDAELAK